MHLVFVSESSHKVDLELLAIAMRTPAPLVCCIIALILSTLVAGLCQDTHLLTYFMKQSPS